MVLIKSKNLEISQAVLICDNFNNEFEPIQSDQQLALVKIVNCPIIEYTLQFLKTSGIEQVIIFSSNARKLKDYLKKRKWIKESDEIPFAIIMASDNLNSLGDVMRDVFNNNLIKNDFILINGNVIAGNIPLLKYLKEHVDRRKNIDKGSIMTLIYMKMNFNHRSRSNENKSIMVVNKDTKKLIFYETINSTGKTKRKISLELKLLQIDSNLRIHFDLQNTHIAICSTAVPQLFADNFDYNTNDDFIHSILVHEEILQNTIYVQTLDEGSYGKKVYDAFSYDSVSRDLIGRWSFPTVPDLQDDLCYYRHNVYKSSLVDLKIDSVLEENLVIGKNTCIDSGTRIKDSVIGENCKIGKNVYLDGSYLMDNVIIGDNCKIRKCILSNNVKVENNCHLKEGCILSANCVVGPDTTLEQCTILKSKSEFSDEKLDLKEFRMQDEDEIDQQKNKFIWGQQLEYNEIIDDSSSNESEISDDKLDDEMEYEFEDEYKKFYDEVIDSLHRGLEEKIECKNLILEINCSKHAYNIPIKDVVCLVVNAILDLPKYIDKSLNDEKQYYSKFQVIFKHCLLLFQNYVKSLESQRDCLLTLEYYTLTNGTLFNVNNFTRVLNELYDKDILSEESILEWSQKIHPLPQTFDSVNQNDRKKLRLNKILNKFINWLIEAEETSSDD